MSYAKAVGQALQRSIELARDEAVKMMRMELSPSSSNQGPLLIYQITSQQHLNKFATGADSDIGGLSQCRLALDEQSRGRFFGTLSSQLPRGSKLERSGYAGFRSRNRPTMFGNQCWDTTVHPYLALRIRNKLATNTLSSSPPSTSPDSEQCESDKHLNHTNHTKGAGTTSSLRAALYANDQSGTAVSRAVHALGLGRNEPPGPKFFVNIQTDGPVTSDLFQHRLYFDESKGSDWQTVLIPLDDFVLTNTGQVAESQIRMMREKIRTVGISTVLDIPNPPSASPAPAPSPDAPPSALSRSAGDGEARNRDSQETLLRGSKRGTTFNFDLGIQAVYAVGSLEDVEPLFKDD